MVNKVYLINPPSYNTKDRIIREGRCMQRESSWSNLWMPLTLCIIKNLLQRDFNIDCKVRDAVADRFTMDAVLNEVNKFQPEIVIVNSAVPTIMKEDLDIVSLIKKRFPNILIFLIGVPSSIMADIIISDKRSKYLDGIIQKEPEFVIYNIIENINKKKDWKKTRGIYYNKNKRFYKNPPPNIADINLLPEADYSDLDLKNYLLPFSREKVVMVETARGCPYNCIFCITKEHYSHNFRFRKPELIAQEIKNIKDKYNIRNFFFWADSWMFGKKKSKELCDKIIKQKMDINFLANGRPDCANQSLLNSMKKAGAFLIGYGIESLCQNILDNMKKNITVEQIRIGLKNTNKAGIKSAAHIIVGLPGETWETVKLTTDRLIKYNPTYVNAYCAMPYPSTELRSIALKNNWIQSNNYCMYEAIYPIMRNKDMSFEDIRKARKYMTQKFYFRPKVVLKEVSEAIMSEKPFSKSYYLITDGLNFMKNWAYK